ncbi:MAG: CHRD domain-containing protein, partial [Planctomycetota bacterium]
MAHDPSQWTAPVLIHAPIDGAQVVDPETGELGSDSDARGTFSMLIDTDTGEFSAELAVAGIPTRELSPETPNWTSVVLREGGPGESGRVVLDLQFYARQRTPENDGLHETDEGFYISLPTGTATFRTLQGDLDVRRSVEEFVSLARAGRLHVAIHTRRPVAIDTVEIRGNARYVPNQLSFRGELSGDSVVRPETFQPPRMGSGSSATGEVRLRIDPVSQRVGCELDVEGITPAELLKNGAISVSFGAPEENGPVVIDFARLQGIAVRTELRSTAEGLRFEAEGTWIGSERLRDGSLHFDRLLDYALAGALYADVRTQSEELFRQGEIRAQLEPIYRSERFRARLDESQVVVPRELRPPDRGTGSEATADAILDIDYDRALFTFELQVSGIATSQLDASHGGNATAVQLRYAASNVNGPILLDVQHYAREEARRRGVKDPSGVESTADGFTLRASGPVLRLQGQHDTFFTADRIVDFLRGGDIYVDVHTTGSELFRAGEIRGNFALETPRSTKLIVLEATLDGDQVVRPSGWTPPLFGSESAANGEFSITIDPRSFEYE